MSLTVETARFAGACWGVERGLRMVRECMDKPTLTYTLGPLIHNPLVVADLESHGVHAVDDLSGISAPATLVLRCHGVIPSVIEEARSLGLEIVDATCPHVKKAHEAAAVLAREHYQVLVLGEDGHPEVEGILARAGSDACVISSTDQLSSLTLTSRVGIVVQTTQTESFLEDVIAHLAGRVKELRIYNTICTATMQRQQAAAELALGCEIMIVVGGKNSGNTRRLVQVCMLVCPNVYHIESAHEIKPEWFCGSERVGVTAGASTPEDQVDLVVQRLKSIC